MTDTFLTRPQALTRISRGDTLFMEHREGERHWWFDGPYEEVGDDVIQEIAFKPGRVCELVEHGDSLFGEVNSQSWKGRVVEKVKEKPIIFGAPMVRALLDGRKTQTRRILKPQPASMIPNVLDIDPPEQDDDDRWGQWERLWSDWTMESRGEPLDEKWCPLRLPYAPGDRLWVREKLGLWPGFAEYDMDGEHVLPPNEAAWEWIYNYAGATVPSIHMPRWASRITLEVTDVRVQRLQEISEVDAEAEGTELTEMIRGKQCWHASHRAAFAALWQYIHGVGTWDENPWIVAVTFVRVLP